MDRSLKPTLVIAAACFMSAMLTLTPSKSLALDNTTVELSDLKISPSTLNLKSKGKYITAHVTLPDEYSTELPPPETVTLHLVTQDIELGDIVALRTKWDLLGRLVAKFPRRDLQDVLCDNIDQFPAIVTLAIIIEEESETLYDTDDIRAINPGRKGKGGGNGKK